MIDLEDLATVLLENNEVRYKKNLEAVFCKGKHMTRGKVLELIKKYHKDGFIRGAEWMEMHKLALIKDGGE